MRQRRLKDLDEKLAELEDYLDSDGRENKGAWRRLFADKAINASWEITRMLYEGVVTEEDIVASFEEPDTRLCLEIGCGKGKFLCDRAADFPDDLFIGVEGQESVIVRAAEKVRDTNHWNIHLLSGYIHDVHEFFDDGEVDVIYLNFSDPWPKAKHAKRRLTHRDYLASYMDILSDRGYIEFKTDNDDLFEFTVEEAEAMGYTISEMTRDLAASDYESAGYRTEYEEKFIEQGIKIKYLKIEKYE